MASASSTARLSPTPETRQCRSVPPSSSLVTSSPVPILTRGGPPAASMAVPSTMTMNSIIAGRRELSPAQGPRTPAICGVTPDSLATSMKWCMGARPSPMNSSVRAPAPSNSQTMGSLSRCASSIMRVFLRKLLMPREPPRMVKSSATTAACRPSILPKPVTTPSAGVCLLGIVVTGVWTWVASCPSSSKLLLSNRRSTRSRAVSLP